MARTLRDVWVDIRYEADDRQGEFLSVGMKADAHSNFPGMLSWITKLDPDKGLNDGQLALLREKFFKDSQNTLPFTVKEKLRNFLDEAAQMNGQIVALDLTTVDLSEEYKTLRFDLGDCTAYQRAQDYTTVATKFPHHAKLIGRILGGEELSGPELQQLIELPNKLDNNPLSLVSDFLSMYKSKITPQMEKLKKVQPSYTTKEIQAAESMQEFWRYRGQKLSNMCLLYNKKGGIQLCEKLGELVALAEKMNCGPSWDEYVVNPRALRDILLDANNTSPPISCKDYAALVNGGAYMSEAVQSLGSDPSRQNNIHHLQAAKNDYEDFAQARQCFREAREALLKLKPAPQRSPVWKI